MGRERARNESDCGLCVSLVRERRARRRRRRGEATHSQSLTHTLHASRHTHTESDSLYIRVSFLFLSAGLLTRRLSSRSWSSRREESEEKSVSAEQEKERERETPRLTREADTHTHTDSLTQNGPTTTPPAAEPGLHHRHPRRPIASRACIRLSILISSSQSTVPRLSPGVTAFVSSASSPVTHTRILHTLHPANPFLPASPCKSHTHILTHLQNDS